MFLFFFLDQKKKNFADQERKNKLYLGMKSRNNFLKAEKAKPPWLQEKEKRKDKYNEQGQSHANHWTNYPTQPDKTDTMNGGFIRNLEFYHKQIFLFKSTYAQESYYVPLL